MIKAAEMAAVGKALGHPMRIEIIRDLRRGGPCSLSEFAKAHGVTISHASFHFKVLRQQGVAAVKNKEGVKLHQLNGPQVVAVLAVLDLLETLGRL